MFKMGQKYEMGDLTYIPVPHNNVTKMSDDETETEVR